MVFSRRSVLISALGLSSLAVVPHRTIAAQSPEAGVSVDPDLASYLALAPASVASLDQAAPFTYGNAKLQMNALGYPLPFDMADPDAQHHWLAGTYAVALPSTFRNYFLMEDFAELTGFDGTQVFSGAEFGEPPSVISALRGAFDIDRIQSVQRELGYQQRDIDGQPVFSLSEEASFSADHPVQRWALGRLNNSAVLDDGTLVYTPTLDAMRTLLAGGTTLGTQPLVQQALGALDGPLATALLLGPGAFVPDIPLDMLLQPDSEDEIADFILSMRDREPAPIVLSAIVGSTPGGPPAALGDEPVTPAPGEPKAVTKMGLVYASAEEATIAAGQIEQRLASGSSMVSGQPWSDLLTSWSAAAADSGNTVLLTMEWPGLPRSLDLVFNRDLAFITG